MKIRENSDWEDDDCDCSDIEAEFKTQRRMRAIAENRGRATLPRDIFDHEEEAETEASLDDADDLS